LYFYPWILLLYLGNNVPPYMKAWFCLFLSFNLLSDPPIMDIFFSHLLEISCVDQELLSLFYLWMFLTSTIGANCGNIHQVEGLRVNRGRKMANQEGLGSQPISIEYFRGIYLWEWATSVWGEEGSPRVVHTEL